MLRPPRYASNAQALLRAVTVLLLSTATQAASAVDIVPLPPPDAGPALTGPSFGAVPDANWDSPPPPASFFNAPPGGAIPVAPPVFSSSSRPPLFTGPPAINPSSGLPWVKQWLPDGLIWRSYLAGVKEPRFAMTTQNNQQFGTFWDATLGARFALFRYGTPTAYRPEGWEVDLEGAAMPRLQPTLDSSPLVSTDYRIGVPVTYANGSWQFKTGYSHISAHLGDEYMILHPGIHRLNYVRDSIMFAVGYFYTENMRLFAEFDYAFVTSDGSEPGEFQFGIDYSPAKRGGAPFAAIYGDLRQELDYGGYFVAQAGWQWRGGAAMHTFRIGAQYLNGMSPQFEFYNQFEQYFSFGLWYDF